MAPTDLHGLKVLVTRPAHQSKPLCDQISALNGVPVCLPCIEIAPPDQPELARSLLLQPVDVMIFISPNAVSWALKLLKGEQLSQTAKIGAVGLSTANTLKAKGIQVDLVPTQSYDSEGLLALDELANPIGRSVIIVRGQGGRPLLRDTLSERGALVEYAEVYQRKRPDTDASELVADWRRQVNLVTVTSMEILNNLIEIIGTKSLPLLQATPIIVISPRMQSGAESMGFRHVILADGANDEAMMAAIDRYISTDQARL